MPRAITVERDCALMSKVGNSVRVRSECIDMRDEAHLLRLRLRSPNPGDPVGLTDGFSQGAIRLARLGYAFVGVAQEIGQSAARSKLRWYMIILRKEQKNQRYMPHYAEYEDARALSTLRESETSAMNLIEESDFPWTILNVRGARLTGTACR